MVLRLAGQTPDVHHEVAGVPSRGENALARRDFVARAVVEARHPHAGLARPGPVQPLLQLNLDRHKFATRLRQFDHNC